MSEMNDLHEDILGAFDPDSDLRRTIEGAHYIAEDISHRNCSFSNAAVNQSLATAILSPCFSISFASCTFVSATSSVKGK